MRGDQSSGAAVSLITITFFVLIAGVIGLGMWGCPQYGVWQQRLAGEAELARAEANRQIAVREAQAKLDSADLLNQAEVKRAHGVAQANHIIGDSLNGRGEYLRYLWINGLTEGNGTPKIIYVPTEAGLPILGAHRSPD